VDDDLEETENRRGERLAVRLTPNRSERGLAWIKASESRRPRLEGCFFGDDPRTRELNDKGASAFDEEGQLRGERTP
jgi:hypothetical protein